MPWSRLSEHRWVSMVALLTTTLAAMALVPGPAEAALPTGCTASSDGSYVTCVYGYTGATQTFVVPAGVTALAVTAVGAAGGDGAADTVISDPVTGFSSSRAWLPGGRGAVVTGLVGVGGLAGSAVQIRVGGHPSRNATSGGYNGGGSPGWSGNPGSYVGAGGGATDLRAGPGLGTRLIVAAGGGGAGFVFCSATACPPSSAGDAGADGLPATPVGSDAQGGRSGGGGAGGAGGARCSCAYPPGDPQAMATYDGSAGSLGQGGAGAAGPPGGGGGGGGLNGGGGGGSSWTVSLNATETAGGGGGGGSSMVPAGGQQRLAAPDQVPSLTLTYVVPPTVRVSIQGHRQYGGPTVGYAVSGQQTDDGGTAVLSGSPTCTTSTTAATPAGSYPGTLSGCSGLSAPDYQVAYLDAGMVVDRAPLAVGADNTVSTYGDAPAAVVPSYRGLVADDTAASLASPATCAAGVTATTLPGTYPGTCTGVQTPNYDVSYLPFSAEVRPAALTVSPAPATTVYGTTPPTLTPSYAGFVNGDGPSALTLRPTCTTAVDAATPVGGYPSSCSGGASDRYSLAYQPGAVSITPASTALAYTGAQQTTVGSTYSPAATLTSSAAACAGGQGVTFSLDRNPVSGATGSFALGAATTTAAGLATAPAVSTTGWAAGAYTVTADDAGTGNCVASTTAAAVVVTSPAGQTALGVGRYTVPGAGKVSFGILVTRTRSGAYAGAIDVVNPGRWWLTGTPGSFTRSSTTQGTVTGTGTLRWWNPAANRGRGGWQVARTGVTFTASLVASSSSTLGAFGVQLGYTPAAPQPAPLPTSGPLTLSSGVVVLS